MTIFPNSKIVKKIENVLSENSEFLMKCLFSGDLKKFEECLHELILGIYDTIAAAFIVHVCESQEYKLRIINFGKRYGFGNYRKRIVSLQLRTGTQIKIPSWYSYKDCFTAYQSLSRHVGLMYWGCISKASPCYYSICSLLAVLCPSFAIGNQLLKHFGVKGTYNRIREIALRVGGLQKQVGAKSICGDTESFAGKRVVISADGGRSRTREYTGKVTIRGNPKFETNWKEPKVFVLQVVNDKGELEKTTELPYYGATMATGQEALEELMDALRTLQIHKAKEIQFIADGAQFFWNNIKDILIQVGVPMNKMTFTLDYFHAVEHLYELVRCIPNMQQKQENQLIKQCKDLLYNGAIYSLIFKVKAQLKGYTNEDIDREINYFRKHYDHMQYKKFKRKKWLLGSGVVESAIRRIINLRFKSASSFWKVEYLDQLIRLRAAFLAGRWNLLIDFLANKINPKLGTK
jgi:hypothetical protein